MRRNTHRNPNGMLQRDDKALENKNKLPLSLIPCHVPLVPPICTTPEPPNSSISCMRRPATSPRSCNVPPPQTLHQPNFVHPASNQHIPATLPQQYTPDISPSIYSSSYLFDEMLGFDLLTDNPRPEEAEITHSTSFSRSPASHHSTSRLAMPCTAQRKCLACDRQPASTKTGPISSPICRRAATSFNVHQCPSSKYSKCTSILYFTCLELNKGCFSFRNLFLWSLVG